MLLPLTIVMNIRIREMYIRIHFLWTWFIFWLIWTVTEHNVKRIGHGLPVLCPSPGCQIWVRVRVITSESESESESSPQSQSPSPRVRVKFFFRVRVTNLWVHIFNICLSSKTWKQTTKCIENVRVNSATRHGRYTAWTRAWLGPESRVTISESESESESK